MPVNVLELSIPRHTRQPGSMRENFMQMPSFSLESVARHCVPAHSRIRLECQEDYIAHLLGKPNGELSLESPGQIVFEGHGEKLVYILIPEFAQES